MEIVEDRLRLRWFNRVRRKTTFYYSEEHLCSFVRLLTDAGSLQRAMFCITSAECAVLGPDIMIEDELSSTYGRMVCGLLQCRAFRNMHLVAGWPKRGNRVNSKDPAIQKRTCEEAKADQENYEAVSTKDGLPAKTAAAVQRSLFQKLSVINFMTCLRTAGYAATPRLQAFMRSKVSGLCATTIIEEIIGKMKNDKSNKAFKRKRRPVQLMASALSSDIFRGRHKWTVVGQDQAVAQKGVKLDMSHFEPEEKRQSLDFSQIESLAPKADWWSPTAGEICVPTADLWLFREFKATNDFDVFEMAHLGESVHFNHFVALREVGSPGDSWFLGLAPAPASSVMVWPCKKTHVATKDSVSYDF